MAPRDGGGIWSDIPGITGVSGQPIESADWNGYRADLSANEFNAARPIVAGGTGATTAIGAHDSLTTKGSDIAAASTLNLDNATGYFVDVTGNTGISAVTLTAGRQRMVRFTGTPTITVGASLIGNNGGSNITVEAGDMAIFEGYASSVVRFWLFRASGAPVGIGSLPDITLVSTDAGASAGPTLTLYRNSASPAALDALGRVLFQGEDSVGNTEDYAEIYPEISTPTSGIEGASLVFRNKISGTMRETFRVSTNAGTLVYSYDAGASAGPGISLVRDSASPANNDALGQILFFGRDAASELTAYASLYAEIVDVTNGSEDGRLKIGATVNGTPTDFMTIDSSGVTVTGAFTSVGIDDNATGERIDIGDTTTAFGATGASYTIRGPADDQSFIIRGGTGANAGVLTLFGGTHATQAGDATLTSGGSVKYQYDLSDTQHEFTGAIVSTAADHLGSSSLAFGGLWLGGSANILWNAGVQTIGIVSNVMTFAGASSGYAFDGLLDLSNSGRIKFPAAQSASADANTLDDYEEGTFTPTIAGTTTAGAGTYTTQTGQYTKIGNVVHFQATLVWTAHTGTGNISIAGLPFTVGANSPVSIDYGTLTFAGPMVTAIAAATTTTILIRSTASGASPTGVAMDTAATIVVTGIYFV